ncbi:MAG: hypothetical protein ACI9A7_000898 [Cyclobacteriaceae bacterium]|jgi:hypothetical protein
MEGEYMVNYKAQNIESLVEKLKASLIIIVAEIETNDRRKVVHVLNPEGNKLELWELIDSVFNKEYERYAIG